LNNPVETVWSQGCIYTDTVPGATLLFFCFCTLMRRGLHIGLGALQDVAPTDWWNSAGAIPQSVHSLFAFCALCPYYFYKIL